VNDYWHLPGFNDVYLEDSWVLNVLVDPALVRFTLNLVLRESHPLYNPPRVGEQYCCWRAELIFESATSVVWEQRGSPPAQDATGALDFGNIDSLQFDSNRYHLEGDWGTMRITSTSVPRIELFYRTP
jgi:hypothetical protein